MNTRQGARPKICRLPICLTLSADHISRERQRPSTPSTRSAESLQSSLPPRVLPHSELAVVHLWARNQGDANHQIRSLQSNHQPSLLPLYLYRSTHTPKRLPRQRQISALINIQRIHARRTSLISRDIRLAEVRRMRGRTAIDDLDDDAVADAADVPAGVAALVGDAVADPAV